MDRDAHRFELGAFECVAVSDGFHAYEPPTFPPPATFLFANARSEEVELALSGMGVDAPSWSSWRSPYICLAVRTGTHVVLIDTGAGSLMPTTGKLAPNLRTAGIELDEVDTVIISHCHPDHIGGTVDRDGRAQFPNARFVMWKGEWDFWMAEESKAYFDGHIRDVLFGVVESNLPPIEAQVELIETEVEIVPGISAVPAPGHTPGHMALRLASADQQMFYLSDTLLHPIHAERPDWHAVVDFDPQQTTETRRRLLRRVEEERALASCFHFPFPGLGRLTPAGETWRWMPVMV